MASYPDDNLDPTRTRTCPYCAEVIPYAARVCPRCRQWLTLRCLRNPAISVWVYGLPHLVLYALLTVLLLRAVDRFENPRPDYTAFINSVRVVESRMDWGQTTNGPRIYITGILTNQSAVAWREIELECRWLDRQGRLVDAFHHHVALTIQPHDDAAFHTTESPTRATNDYATFRLSVSMARNTKGYFW